VSSSEDLEQLVGPVLHTTPFALAVVSVIEEENQKAVIVDEGAYLRVLAPRVCRLSRAGLETATGPDIRFPGDLEVVMSSFAGVLELTEDGAVWRLASESSVDPDAAPKGDR
jgi:toluene monooxygenase system protein D